MDLPKFIIQDNEMRLGRVELHEELADKNGGEVIGGGRWFANRDYILFYHKSYDYGTVTPKDLETCYMRASIGNLEVRFSEEENFEKAKLNYIVIENETE